MGRPRIDMTGKRFGELTVIEFSHMHKDAYWKCLCDCGNEKVIPGYNLRNGHTKSCGHLKGKNRLELKGRKFNRLTVIEFSHMHKNKSFWKCLCDCGNEKVINGSALVAELTTSCGCLQKDQQSLPEGIAARNRVMLWHKNSAKKRNLEQALTDEQILILHKGNCHYCGSPPSNICHPSGANGSYIYNGIDRKDNSEGYTINNSVSCCFVCNAAKGTLGYDKYLKHIKATYLHLIKIK